MGFSRSNHVLKREFRQNNCEMVQVVVVDKPDWKKNTSIVDEDHQCNAHIF